jgi:glucose-6-phosphate-specific signal transduction histidine kinase
MHITKKTIVAIALNLLLPGAGYLFIGAKSRKPLAIFLIFITLFQLVRTFAHIAHGDTHQYAINVSPLFPGLTLAPLGVMLAAVLSVDTYFSAQARTSTRPD